MGTDVAVIGLGNLGAGLVRALTAAGLSVTVWNRTPGRLDGLAPLKIRFAESAVDAASSSETIIMAVSDYDAARHLLDEIGGANLSGRLILQWMGGTPDEARALGDRLANYRARVVDVLLLSYPSDLESSAVVYVAGASEDVALAASLVFSRTQWIWTNVGQDLGRAKAMGHILEPMIDHAVEGFLIGAALAEHEGMGMLEYFEASRTAIGVAAQTLEGTAALIDSGTYISGQMTLTLWSAGLDRQIAHAEKYGIDVTTLRHIRAQMDQRIAAGFGNEDIAGLHAVIRGSSAFGTEKTTAD
ncbi:NAD(P)-binding domain-containing protein [Salinibacterium sp. ZJ450]|uniref:NAD(P)-binding domain-containing protein n=1 Tax=Salinibacterium sp. ZJ450 TaxID=2708338 RepID=UPI0014247808|nr:NAD(P)-binding domain-containing protein [Salinibacterium sp. ZJ450]